MSRWSKLICMVVVLVFGAAFIGSTTVRAQDGTTAKQAQAKFVRDVYYVLLSSASKSLNIPTSDLVKELAGGKSLMDVITAHNGQVDSIKADAKATVITNINQAVTNNTITQDQANKATASLDKLLDLLLNRKNMALVNRTTQLLQAQGLSGLIKELSAETSVSQRDILSALRNGKTLADIANDNKVDPSNIVSVVVKQLTPRINTLVKNGKLSQDAGDKLITALPDSLNKLTTMQNPLNSYRKGQGGKKLQATPQATQNAPTSAATMVATPSL